MNVFRNHIMRIHTRARRWIVAALLLVAMMGTLFMSHAPRAQAQSVTVVGGNGTIQETISAAANVAVSAVQQSLHIKEFVLDDIAFGLAKTAMQQVTKSIIRWINSGFEGGPAFITDLEGFIEQSADEIAGEIIYGSDLKALCSPFELDVRIALELSYNPTLEERVQCTLSDVVTNVDEFLNGNFAAGGLPGWFEVTMNPNNNFFGAYASAESALRSEIANRKEANLAKLNWGDGFFAKQECETITWGNGETEEICNDVLPGQIISDALSFELSTGQRTLIEADEINEIISALFTQLATEALQGAGGLLGLTRTGGSYGSTSYIDRINNPQFDPFVEGTGNDATSDDFIAGAIGDETQYRNLYSGVVSRAEAIMVQVSGPSCSSAGSIRAQTQPILDQALAEQNAADANLAQLRDMETRYGTAAGVERENIVEEFLTLKASGQLHSNITVARDRYEVDRLIDQLTNIARDIPRNCGGSGTNNGE